MLRNLWRLQPKGTPSAEVSVVVWWCGGSGGGGGTGKIEKGYLLSRSVLLLMQQPRNYFIPRVPWHGWLHTPCYLESPRKLLLFIPPMVCEMYDTTIWYNVYFICIRIANNLSLECCTRLYQTGAVYTEFMIMGQFTRHDIIPSHSFTSHSFIWEVYIIYRSQKENYHRSQASPSILHVLNFLCAVSDLIFYLFEALSFFPKLFLALLSLINTELLSVY